MCLFNQFLPSEPCGLTFSRRSLPEAKAIIPSPYQWNQKATCAFNQNQAFLEKPLASLNRGFSFWLPSRHMLCLVWLFSQDIKVLGVTRIWPPEGRTGKGTRGGANMDGCHQLWKFQTFRADPINCFCGIGNWPLTRSLPKGPLTCPSVKCKSSLILWLCE